MTHRLHRDTRAVARSIVRALIGGCWLLGSLFARDAFAATFAWTGLSAIGAQWSQPSNWNPAGPPPPGSDLIFPDAAMRKDNVNDLAPGTVFGSISIVGSGYRLAGNLDATGIVSLAAPGVARYRVELRGTQGGLQHDALHAGVSADLTGALLDVALADGFVPPNESEYVIVSAPAIIGKFAQGPFVGTAGGYRFEVRYHATEVVLVRVPTLRTWTGSGADDRWTTAQNWDSGTTPLAGDALMFPKSALRRTSTNDLPDDMVLHGIQFDGVGYVLQGDPLTLVRGFLDTSTDAATGNQVRFRVSLPPGRAAPLRNDGRSTLAFSHVEIPAGSTIGITGTSPVRVDRLSGAGTLAKSSTSRLELGGAGDNASATVVRINAGTLAVAHAAGPGASGEPGTGILRAGPTSFNAQSTTLELDLGGTTPGTDHDQIQVTGMLDPGGAVLSARLVGGHLPLPSNRYTIATAGTLGGQFAQGSAIVVGGIPFAIEYTSSSVVLVAPATRILDIDLDNRYEPLTDGLMVLRYLFGLPAAAVTSDATGASATRDADAIFRYLGDVRPYLDADGNGVADALTDGVLILRHLFGQVGQALIEGAIGARAKRTTPEAIAAYLAALMPGP